MNTLFTFPSTLTEREETIVAKAGAEYGVTVFDLATEISYKINEMSIAEAVKASRWYFEANTFAQYLADTYNVSLEIAAAVISSVSPRMPWLRNKTIAETILTGMGNFAELSADDAAKEMALGLNSNISMAIKIARGADIDSTLTGVKRRSFYNNILSPSVDDSVTVDTWMARTYMNITGADLAKATKFIRANEKGLGFGAGYYMIAIASRMVASEMNMLPHQIQACYWTLVSGSIDGGRADIS